MSKKHASDSESKMTKEHASGSESKMWEEHPCSAYPSLCVMPVSQLVPEQGTEPMISASMERLLGPPTEVMLPRSVPIHHARTELCSLGVWCEWVADCVRARYVTAFSGPPPRALSKTGTCC
jgi:hypothetical protein